MTRTARLAAALVATGLLAVGLLAGGCASGSAGEGQVTITVATGWGDTPAVRAAFEGVVRNFEAAHPDIKVDLETSGSNAYNQSINLRAASASPPDVFMLSTAGYGPGFYNLAMAGHLEPLDQYAARRGWVARFADSALRSFTVDRSTGALGSGALYGLPQQSTVLGVYYNKALLSRLGFTAAPTDPAGFGQTLAAAKAAGITPIAATKDAYVHLQMTLWNAFETSAEPINAFVYGRSDTFASGGNLRALETLRDWQHLGYLQSGSLGLPYAGAVSTFTRGDALYFVAGPWLTGTVTETLGRDAGFMRMPSVSTTSPVGGGPSSPLVISARSEHIGAGVEFLDFVNSPAQSDYLLARGFGLTGISPWSTTGGNPLDAEAAAILNQAEAPGGGGITPYINWASPTVNNDIYSGLEKLLGRQISITEYLTKVRSDWEASRRERGGG